MRRKINRVQAVACQGPSHFRLISPSGVALDAAAWGKHTSAQKVPGKTMSHLPTLPTTNRSGEIIKSKAPFSDVPPPHPPHDQPFRRNHKVERPSVIISDHGRPSHTPRSHHSDLLLPRPTFTESTFTKPGVDANSFLCTHRRGCDKAMLEDNSSILIRCHRPRRRKRSRTRPVRLETE